MRILCWLCALFFSSHVLADPTYPVQWTDEVKLHSLAEIPELLAKKTAVTVDYVRERKDQHIVAKSCNDYFILTDMKFFPANNMEIAAESFFKNCCDPLVYLQKAIPAKKSFIRTFDLQKDYGLLPAAIIFPDLSTIDSPKGDLKTAYQDIKVIKNSSTNKNNISISSSTADMRTDISLLAFGDFNQDGLDEMLIFVATRALHGTYHYYSTYLLSRHELNNPIVKAALP